MKQLLTYRIFSKMERFNEMLGKSETTKISDISFESERERNS